MTIFFFHFIGALQLTVVLYFCTSLNDSPGGQHSYFTKGFYHHQA